jgi:hypothetical protein
VVVGAPALEAVARAQASALNRRLDVACGLRVEANGHWVNLVSVAEPSCGMKLAPVTSLDCSTCLLQSSRCGCWTALSKVAMKSMDGAPGPRPHGIIFGVQTNWIHLVWALMAAASLTLDITHLVAWFKQTHHRTLLAALRHSRRQPMSSCAGPHAYRPHTATCCPNPSSRIALPFRMPGLTRSLKPASSKSAIQRSGVISG